MPRIGFISSLFISLALIGGALWFRFVRIPPYRAQLVTVKEVGQFSPENTYLEDFQNASSSLATLPTTTLSPTETVGRQLFSDFIALKSQGETTPDNIDALADKYAESIKNFDVAIPKVDPSQVIVLPDSEKNLTVYGNAITNIRNKYKNLVATQAESSGGGITNINSPAFSTFMSAVGKLYQSSTNELLLVVVPASLVTNHIDLINNYLESAEVMASLGNTSKDPIRAYAALNINIQNTGKESKLLSNIRTTLMANGIIFDNSI